MKVLKARLYDKKLNEQNSEIAAARKLIVKRGDRSDKLELTTFLKIELQITRIGLTLYNLSDIIQGDLNELVEKLKLADRAEKLHSS